MNTTEKRFSIRLAFMLVTTSLFWFSCMPEKPNKDTGANKQTLRRSDSFFGLHFDFHANKNDSAVGKTFTAEMIDSLRWPEILGTLAGDNTILMIVRTAEEVTVVLRRIDDMLR